MLIKDDKIVIANEATDDGTTNGCVGEGDGTLTIMTRQATESYSTPIFVHGGG